MGSVKDLIVVNDPSIHNLGDGIFEFSDRYSVFDWGEMPDQIDDKGASLATTAAKSFTVLNESGVPTHYIAMLPSGDELTPLLLYEMKEPSNRMAVKLARKIPIDNDYAEYKKPGLNNYIIPIEIVVRNALPKGSSIFKDIKAAKEKGTLKEILDKLRLSQEPKEGDWLPWPVLDFSTKFEETDRKIPYEKALCNSGLTIGQFGQLLITAETTNNVIQGLAKAAGMERLDGKIECIYSNGKIIVADVVGTFDEDRFMLNGRQVSKEFLRQWYKQNDPEWVAALDETKKQIEAEKKAAEAKSEEYEPPELRDVCKVKPRRLPADLRKLVSDMYRAGCNRYCKWNFFDAPPLERVMIDLEPYMKGK